MSQSKATSSTQKHEANVDTSFRFALSDDDDEDDNANDDDHASSKKKKSNTIQVATSKQTKHSKSVNRNENETNEQCLNDQLERLKKSLEKSFRLDFINALCYFISLENQSQTKLAASWSNFEWKQVDHFLQQFKKMCKNKIHLKHLLEKALIDRHEKTESNESEQEEERFSLLKIIVSLLLKLVRINATNKTTTSTMSAIDTKLFDLKLMLMSCLADLCYYEDLRAQIMDDKNLKELFEAFSNGIKEEIDRILKAKSQAFSSSSSAMTSGKFDLKIFENYKRIWSKMIRLASNICQEKNSIKIKDLISNDFLSCLSKLLEQCQQEAINRLSETNDLDFYHSILRLVRFGCEFTDFQNVIIQNRLLVHLSRFMYKYNRLVECDDTVSIVNRKSLQLSKEMIKQYLIIIDNWPMPICSEFYNQMIEGNTIDHLLMLQENEKKTIVSIDETDQEKQIQTTSKSTGSDGESSKQSNSTVPFDYAKFSFSLMFKFCRDYHACCSEFGRLGGLTKYMSKIELIDSQADKTMKHHEAQTLEHLIEMICLSCKESINRLRLREQGYLIYLLRLQQKLCKQMNANKEDKQQHQEADCMDCDDSAKKKSFDSLTHNKLLTALCCFAHDQESMNILLANGFVDALLVYINETVSVRKNDNENDYDSFESLRQRKNAFQVDFESPYVKFKDLKSLLLIDKSTIANSNTQAGGETSNANENKLRSVAGSTSKQQGHKRKKSDSTSESQGFEVKRTNSLHTSASTSKLFKRARDDSTSMLSPSHDNFSLPASTSLSLNESYIGDRLMSPNEASLSPGGSISPSFGAPSPTFSMASSPSLLSRCNSTTSMLYCSTGNASNQNNIFMPSFSDSPSPASVSNGMPSPNFYWQMSSNTNEYDQIQFSPSVKNDDSSGNDDDDDDDEEVRRVDELKTDTTLVSLSPKSTASTSSTTISSYLNHHLCTSALASQKNIETINRTEACVFYVLSQLSHGEKPSVYLFSNFEAILVALLNYLRHATVRNPRALRILNRLTKNQYCFYHFVLSKLPYKLKSIFYGATSLARSGQSNKSTIQGLTSGRSSSAHVDKQEELIEKEMHVYLNSNKVFFDEHMFFPSFESIDHTLCNNLKSQCLSSSDHGFFCLTSMMKSSLKRDERLSCVLVSPFILRNSRALQQIMIQLNGLDLIIELLLARDTTDSDLEQLEARLLLQHKAILCVKRILNFVNYNRDARLANEMNTSARLRYVDRVQNELTRVEHDMMPINENVVRFMLKSDPNKTIVAAKRQPLVDKSAYFGALLCGNFRESHANQLNDDNESSQMIELEDIESHTFQIILDMLGCRVNDIDMPSASSYAQFLDIHLSRHHVTYEHCESLVLACDRFFLLDMRDLFISILITHFIDFSTWTSCFELAWQINSILLVNALVDFLLAKIQITLWNVNEKRKCVETADETSSSVELLKCSQLFDMICESLSRPDTKRLDLFRKCFKQALVDIIKTNSWKFTDLK